MPLTNQSSTSIRMSGMTGGPNNNDIAIWSSIITPTGNASGNGFTIDISEAGFKTITNIQLTVANNTNALASIPLISLKSYTPNSVVVNVLNVNTIATVLVNATTGLVFATNIAGYTIHIRVEGY